ncbi:tyrosine-type recombinase/integrase [Serratia quinivorans]|uniref:tyrosine-type recombinase/integrase n=1 Tax=Serratia quinivorans TaxID=137545 RepID=UPI00217B37C3|nr:site-specific integrase [Serratia quinivorans]CAI0894398.1 Site-specific recombinase XerD [Serratia quinivorans]
MSNKVSHKLSHTIQRGRTFYTNFRVNDSKKFVRLSLNTDSLKQAQVTMSKMAPYIPLVQSGTMSVDEFKGKLNGLRELTKQDLDSFLIRQLQSELSEVEIIPEIGRFSKQMFGFAPDRGAARGEATRYLDGAHDQINEGSEFAVGLLEYYLRKDGIDPAGLPRELGATADQINLAQALKYQAYEAFYSNDTLKYRQIVESLRGQVQEVAGKVPVAPPSAPRPQPTQQPYESTHPTIRLSEAWGLYIEDKGQKWRSSVAGENQRFYDVLFYVVGDIPVDSVTKQHIREALQVAENLPARTRKPYSGMSLTECIAYDVPEEDLISSEHVHKHLKIWRSLFKTYLVDHKDILKASPTEGISYEVISNRGGHYSAGEMTRLKRTLTDLPGTDWRRDYFLTLIYTGARRGEIADIRKNHIRQDEETGRYYIFIEGGKTDHAQRQIPIHQKLENELSKRIATLADDDLVFAGLPDYTSITNSWVSVMDSLGIPTYDEFGLKRRIHSLRHTFISTAIANVTNAALVQFVVGHSRTQSLGITARYTHRPPLKELLPVVDSIS